MQDTLHALVHAQQEVLLQESKKAWEASEEQDKEAAGEEDSRQSVRSCTAGRFMHKLQVSGPKLSCRTHSLYVLHTLSPTSSAH